MHKAYLVLKIFILSLIIVLGTSPTALSAIDQKTLYQNWLPAHSNNEYLKFCLKSLAESIELFQQEGKKVSLELQNNDGLVKLLPPEFRLRILDVSRIAELTPMMQSKHFEQLDRFSQAAPVDFTGSLGPMEVILAPIESSRKSAIDHLMKHLLVEKSNYLGLTFYNGMTYSVYQLPKEPLHRLRVSKIGAFSLIQDEDQFRFLGFKDNQGLPPDQGSSSSLDHSNSMSRKNHIRIGIHTYLKMVHDYFILSALGISATEIEWDINENGTATFVSANPEFGSLPAPDELTRTLEMEDIINGIGDIAFRKIFDLLNIGRSSGPYPTNPLSEYFWFRNLFVEQNSKHLEEPPMSLWNWLHAQSRIGFSFSPTAFRELRMRAGRVAKFGLAGSPRFAASKEAQVLLRETFDLLESQSPRAKEISYELRAFLGDQTCEDLLK